MTSRNPEYDFEWCPGCGDFGVRRALEFAVEARMAKTELPMENNVVVAGIGCSGNMVHLLEGSQPFGFHGIHGRTLPVAFGIKMARLDLNVLVVAGDGDFLSIGGEHIAPTAQRNLNITAVIMDNGVYGLTKGQSSPTTELEEITSTTPYGKLESALNPLDLYLTLGVPFIASSYSVKPKELAKIIEGAMDYPGFAIVHVQSPCTEYNDTYEELKGNAKKGIAPAAWGIPDDHDPSDRDAAYKIIHSGGIPLGLIYKQKEEEPLEKRLEEVHKRVKTKSAQELLDSYQF